MNSVIKDKLDVLLAEYHELSNVVIKEYHDNPYLSERARVERDACLVLGKKLAAWYQELTENEYSWEFNNLN